MTSLTTGIKSLVSNCPKSRAEGETQDVEIELALAPFILAVMKGGYYSYSGSLTTPGKFKSIKGLSFVKLIEHISMLLAETLFIN